MEDPRDLIYSCRILVASQGEGGPHSLEPGDTVTISDKQSLEN